MSDFLAWLMTINWEGIIAGVISVLSFILSMIRTRKGKITALVDQVAVDKSIDLTKYQVEIDGKSYDLSSLKIKRKE